MSQRLLRLLTVATLLLILPAVGCESSTGSEPSVAGTYTLQTINGGPLPGTVQVNTKVNASQIVLDDVSLFSGFFKFSVNAGPEQTETWTGTYVRNGSNFTFNNPNDSDPETGTVVGNTLTLNAGGHVFVYTK
jgi:hypothetical protein